MNKQLKDKNITPVEIPKEKLPLIRKIELNILDEFVEICNKLNLKYFLCAGTLLGAIRHKGFIPWDDDIDVQMPRDDYEKFLKLAPSLLSENLKISSIYSEKDFLGDFFKIVNIKTSFIEVSTHKLELKRGFFIDVFPIDTIPNNKFSKFNYKFWINIYNQRVVKGYFVHSVYTQKTLKGKLFSILSGFVTLWMSPQKAALRRHKFILKKKIINAKHSIVESKCNRLYDSNIFADYIFVEFEGKKYRSPSLIHEYLTIQYGNNYMELPPIEKRVSHHYCVSYDLSYYE